MKAIIIGIITALIPLVSNGQHGYYASLGITHIPFNKEGSVGLNLGGSIGLSYTFKHHVYSLNIKEYREFIDQIIFIDYKPNRVIYNWIYQIEYAYLIAFDKKEILMVLPALGAGYYKGRWRTDEAIPGTNSGWFDSSPNYEDKMIEGFCFTPQLEFLIRARFIGLGFGATFNFIPANSLYNTQNVFVRVLFGNINKLDKSDKRPSVGK